LLSPEMVMPLPKMFWSWAAAFEELMKKDYFRSSGCSS
jgi:hypothetical protein